MYYVYVLENESGRWYIGQTNSLRARIIRHNTDTVRSTKNRGIWKVIYKEEFTNRSDAMKREEYLKSGYGRRFLKDLLMK